MGHAIGGIVPLALAAALSSLPIMAMFVILLSPRRRESALPFLIGWVLGCLAVLVIATVAAQAIPVERERRPDTTIGVLEIVIGVALVGLGLFGLRGGTETGTGRLPRWVERIDSFGSLPALGIGLALNLRPKALLLGAAASLVIRGAHINVQQSLLVIVVFAAVATSTVSVPTVLTLLFPERMEPRINAARAWLGRYGVRLTALVMIAIGVATAVAGIARL